MFPVFWQDVFLRVRGQAGALDALCQGQFTPWTRALPCGIMQKKMGTARMIAGREKWP
jgi:hypothetical protein